MIVNKKDLEKKTEDFISYFEENRNIADKYDKELGLLLSKARTIFSQIDTTEVEDVDFGNSIIDKINVLIDIISQNSDIKLNHLRYINYTDETGKPLLDFFTYVVGDTLIDNGETVYLNRRIVKARNGKEAIFKYKKVIDDGSTSVSCLGLLDNDEAYSKNIENLEIIE